MCSNKHCWSLNIRNTNKRNLILWFATFFNLIEQAFAFVFSEPSPLPRLYMPSRLLLVLYRAFAQLQQRGTMCRASNWVAFDFFFFIIFFLAIAIYRLVLVLCQFAVYIVSVTIIIHLSNNLLGLLRSHNVLVFLSVHQKMLFTFCRHGDAMAMQIICVRSPPIRLDLHIHFISVRLIGLHVFWVYFFHWK